MRQSHSQMQSSEQWGVNTGVGRTTVAHCCATNPPTTKFPTTESTSNPTIWPSVWPLCLVPALVKCIKRGIYATFYSLKILFSIMPNSSCLSIIILTLPTTRDFIFYAFTAYVYQWVVKYFKHRHPSMPINIYNKNNIFAFTTHWKFYFISPFWWRCGRIYAKCYISHTSKHVRSVPHCLTRTILFEFLFLTLVPWLIQILHHTFSVKLRARRPSFSEWAPHFASQSALITIKHNSSKRYLSAFVCSTGESWRLCA